MTSKNTVEDPPVAAAGAQRGGRLEFLDALRGVAAMAVVVQHALELTYDSYARWTVTYFRPGEFGVVVFFLCSGFIIPASLERHSSQRRFWIGRFFRLYPAYWTALAAVLLLHFGFDEYAIDPQFDVHPVRLSLANATMIHDFLGVPLALGQSWTLAYEMAFYAMVGALFVAGLQRKASTVAVTAFAVAAVVGTQLVPPRALTDAGPRGIAAIIVVTALAGGFMLRVTRGTGTHRLLAVAVAVAGVPLLFNRPEAFNTTALLIGTLFAGSVIQGWMVGRVTAARMTFVVGAAVASVVAMQFTTNVYWLGSAEGDTLKRAITTTYLGAYAVFLAAVLLRDRRFPRPLLYLGTISYSLYLFHSIVIYVVGWIGASKLLTAAVWVGGSIVVAAISYRLVEKPAINLGRRLGAGRTATAPAAS